MGEVWTVQAVAKGTGGCRVRKRGTVRREEVWTARGADWSGEGSLAYSRGGRPLSGLSLSPSLRLRNGFAWAGGGALRPWSRPGLGTAPPPDSLASAPRSPRVPGS